ncbi:[LysW]-aminoadipate kinase [Nocardiopsis sp. FIRDI 009]|uniref:[LysW]-aminoadipate kinase n=1 Tax=Nocardiopsis sp. FIRDI 009 TaxID=714197 RepID=UPI000E25D290|nr:[LysW]-aminoadipate kinase [Nocardiopsis sp. FIRDI 009]
MSDDVLVVKIGGDRALNRAGVCRDLGRLVTGGRRVVLVHGGAADLDDLARRLGVPQRRLTTPGGTSSRYTDPASMEVLRFALLGGFKPELVCELARNGVSAVGLSGMDGGLIRARRPRAYRALVDGRTRVVRDDHSGRITGVDPSLPMSLLAAGAVPVLSPPALGEDSHPVNVDADRAAAAVAAALSGAGLPTRLVLLTAAPGLLADHTDESSLLTETLLAPEGGVGGAAVGGMSVKLRAARHALLGGASSAVISDGRVESPVLAAVAGEGTRVRVAEPVGSPR